MEDSTTTPQSAEINNGLRIACPVIGIFLTSCAAYIMISLILHFVTSRKRAKALKNRMRITEGSRREKHRNKVAIKLSKWLGYLSVASSIFAFLNCAVDVPSVYLRESSNKTCKILMSFSFIFYPCGVACVYSFLWARQRVFYSSPTIGLIHSKYLRWTSFAILPIFLILMVAGVISTLSIYIYETSGVGCTEVSGNDAPKIVMYVATLVMQATLLGLFLYPLKEHTDSEENELPENKLLLSLIKRACLITVVCVLADTTAFIVVMVLPSDGPSVVVNLIRDGNLLVNVICVVCSFVDWRDRLAPICRGTPEDHIRPGEIKLIKSVKSDPRGSTTQSNSQRQSLKVQPSLEV